MKIITPEPPKALEYNEIPDGSVFKLSLTNPVYFLKLCDGNGAVSLIGTRLHPASDFTHEGKKFFIVDAELVIK